MSNVDALEAVSFITYSLKLTYALTHDGYELEKDDVREFLGYLMDQLENVRKGIERERNWTIEHMAEQLQEAKAEKVRP